jgi:hypothetical protein
MVSLVVPSSLWVYTDAHRLEVYAPMHWAGVCLLL